VDRAAHPAQGPQCLLDEVLSWDATRIRCGSATHRSADNPLRCRAPGAPLRHRVRRAGHGGLHGALVAASAPVARGFHQCPRQHRLETVGYLGERAPTFRGTLRAFDDLEADLSAVEPRIQTSYKITLLLLQRR